MEATKERPPRTLKDLAVEAHEVQRACNLLAVVRGMDRALTDLRRLESLGTDALRAHPIAVLWADKSRASPARSRSPTRRS